MIGLIVGRPALVWLVVMLLSVMGGGTAGWLTLAVRHDEHLSRLNVEAERRGVEIMSQTLNGNIMGALSLLGSVAQDIKLDARGDVPANLPRIAGLLEDVGRAHDAQGVFVVGGDGYVHSSWDSSGRPSTGTDVRFRPYYKMAMQGNDSVYAAVSLARGDRSLYFSAPVRTSTQRSSAALGAVVARTGLERVDHLLKERAGLVLLLSPQGVVFASSQEQWVGHLAGGATPERLAAIRELKQFGAMFEKADPPVLPFSTEPGIVPIGGRSHALASARVRWNDPYGDWAVVLADDLSATSAVRDAVAAGLVTGLVVLVVVWLLFNLARGHRLQMAASRRIEQYAREQEEGAERKARRAEAAMKLQRTKSLGELCRVFLAEAHDILGALQGAVYVFERDGAPGMTLQASYAAAADLSPELAPGAGLLGQCVLDCVGRVLTGGQVAGWSIRSGLGHAQPGGVMMAPLMLDDRPLGVVEVAVLAVPSAVSAAQFEELAALLALNIEILRRQGTAMGPSEAAP